jgi:hypothetical protein
LSYRGVVGRRIPEPGQARLRTNRARDCQERPSTAGAAHHRGGAGGEAGRKSTVDRVPGVVA